MIKIKKGVKVDGLKQVMIEPIEYLNALHSLCGVDFVITDAVSERDNPSLHPQGFAFDWRTRNLNKNKVDLMCYLLGERFPELDIIKYSTHAHVEYQLFLDMQESLNIGSFENAIGHSIKQID